MFLGPAITFIVVSVLLLWLVIGARGKWFFKTVAIIAGVWYSVAIYITLPTILGWPSKTELPAKYEVFWIDVHEPIKGTNDAGYIDIWVKDLTKSPNNVSWWSLFSPNKKDSRLHRLGYTKNLHKQAIKALKLIKQGKRVIGSNGQGKGKNGRGRGKGGRKGSNHGGGDQGDNTIGPKWYLMPKVKYPPKK